MIIFFGIVDAFPFALKTEWSEFMAGNRNIFIEVFLLVLMVAITAFVVILTQGQRRIRVQYPKKVIGRKIYGGQSTYIPLRVNTAGVIPIIFAQAINVRTPDHRTAHSLGFHEEHGRALFQHHQCRVLDFFGALILFFTYFYTAIVFNPVDLADNLKKYGAVIPQKPPERRPPSISIASSRGSRFLVR